MSKDRVLREKVPYHEPNMLFRFDHPNIVKLFGAYCDDANFYLAMEFCDGSVLLESRPEEQVRTLAYQMLCAVAQMHEQRICHLDIKPSNFMMKSNSANAELKLLDLEFAADITKNYNVVARGTLGYIAPELLEGLCGLSCDIWSLGVTLYYLLSGDEPFKGKDHIEVSMHALTKKLDLESGVYHLGSIPV